MLQTETDRNNLANSVYSLHIWLYLFIIPYAYRDHH